MKLHVHACTGQLQPTYCGCSAAPGKLDNEAKKLVENLRVDRQPLVLEVFQESIRVNQLAPLLSSRLRQHLHAVQRLAA